MRITGNRMIDMAQQANAANQSKAAIAANEASSGLRVEKPSDDPEAWAAAQRANAKKTVNAGSVSALETGRERLGLTDNALGSIGDALSSMRELAVQGSNASYGASDREKLAVQVRALFAGAVEAANTRSADGEYILAGSASNAAPFSNAGVYGGDATSRELPITDSATAVATVSGSVLTAGNGVDVLPLFDRVAKALETNDQAALSSLLGEIDTATKQVGLARTRTGGTMNVLDAALTAHAQLATHLASEVSRAVESDLVASASNLAKTTQALEASRAITSHIVALVDPTK
jgi:flagellar hook-associated protein 3 FlgL